MPHRVNSKRKSREDKNEKNEKNEKNRIFSSVTFYSTIKLIFDSLTTTESLLQSLTENLKESHHQTIKKCVKDIVVELKNIRCYNNTLNKDIFPVLTHGCASWYIYTRLI